MTCPILSLRESKDDLKATLREVIQAESQFCSYVDMYSFEEYTRGAGVERLTRPRRAIHADGRHPSGASGVMADGRHRLRGYARRMEDIRLTRYERKPDREVTALARRTGHLQSSSMSHYQIAGDAQTQSHSMGKAAA
jgi:hypothetical protein